MIRSALRTRGIRHRLIAFILLAVTSVAGGCGGGGTLAVRSSLEPITLTGDFTTAVYAFDDHNNLDVLLIEGAPENPTQVVHIRMHWLPRAGSTPVDPRATNATIRYLVFTGEAAGMYSGAGFLFPRTTPGGETFRGSLRNTTLRLEDRTQNFIDRLGHARATGSFSAHRDDAALPHLLRQIQVRLRQQLGYPRFVDRDRTQMQRAL